MPRSPKVKSEVSQPEYPFETAPGPGALFEVVDGVYWLRMPLPFAMGETLSHLNYLRHRRKLKRQCAPDGLYRFARERGLA